jgi:hypothetical protein
VVKLIEDDRRRLLRDWEQDQHTDTTTFCAVTPAPAESYATILAQELKAPNPFGRVLKRLRHSQAPHFDPNVGDLLAAPKAINIAQTPRADGVLGRMAYPGPLFRSGLRLLALLNGGNRPK